ncbi:MAG: DUF1501 domain-containing protein [Pirellulaceae bacterium]
MNHNQSPLCTGFSNPSGMSRRALLGQLGMGFGSLALSNMLLADGSIKQDEAGSGVLGGLHHPARAKRVIFLLQSGAPSQMDLLDHKPALNELQGQQLPDSIRQGQRLTGMSAGQTSLPLVGTPFDFAQHGESGHWFSELLHWTSEIADELCVIKSMYTEAINHGPGVTFLQTGSPFPGRPSMGSWLNYGLGSENDNLPSFVVLVTKDQAGQPIFSRLWGSGFLPSEYSGVRFRSGDQPVLYIDNPAGMERAARRNMLDALSELHKLQTPDNHDPQIESRIQEYEMAYRMQESIPEVADVSDEPDHIFKLYGRASRKPGSFAANCLMARRLAERGVRFVQLYHRGWDHHTTLPASMRKSCAETDRATAALIKDLRDRGMLEDTLVIWGGEFGRTSYCQGKLTPEKYGRDHHPRCFTIWMAGGGVRAGTSWGETDEFSYNIARDGVHIHDLQATILHMLGIDHERLTYRHQGRRYRLTDVHGKVVHGLLA